MLHNPFVDRKKGYYAFTHGQVGFVILDLRRYRNSTKKTLLSDDQFNWLKKWFKQNGEKCRVVFVACSVPLAHLTYAISRKAKQWYMDHTGFADDLRDQWNSRANISDAKRFTKLMFDESNEKNIKIVILGGDVHVGTIAVIRSFEPEHVDRPVIYQFTSSPISNKPTKIAKYLDAIWPEFKIGKHMNYSARILKIFTKRNFGIIHVKMKQRPGYRSKYDISFEMHREDKVKPKIFPI
jgi:phosphodiesterase/alkaline phosphatase D-like protein